MMYWGGPSNIWMTFGMSLFWVAIVVGGVLLVRELRGRAPVGASSSQPESALEIVKRRYAQGEIDREEFVKLMQDLR